MDAVVESEDRTPRRGFPVLGVAAAVAAVAGVVLDRAFGWFEPAFTFVAHLFYEVPVLEAVRAPSQLALAKVHLPIVAALLATVEIVGAFQPRWKRLGRWFVLGFAIRSLIWIVGSNLPLVPGDSSHYIEVASSVYRGEGPVKHYVESFFVDYPAIRLGKGVLDDWATPLYAYVLAGAYRLTGVDPTSAALETTLGVAKGTSFVLNLLCLPALYLFTRRRLGSEKAELALAILAVLPVHALYAGFELRESLVALTSILAVWFLTEVGEARGASRWGWAVAAGIAGGLAILARNTAMALLAGAALFMLLAYGKKVIPALIAWGLLVSVVIAPWAVATFREYGEPFYTYTKFFQYTFSWTVHHYQDGKPSASTFYTAANAPEIVRVKFKALTIIATTSTMILGLPAMIAFLVRLLSPTRGKLEGLGFCLTLAFVGGTVANVADVTQVAQLGRYYLPLFCLLIPSIAGTFHDWSRLATCPPRGRGLIAVSFAALLWSDPTWAYDFTWLVKPYQLHWSALREAGDWIKSRPDAVPPDARIMTWFPWELRIASQRTTVLMPRNFDARRIEQVIKQYGVTHFLWGSFEMPPNMDTESMGRYLEAMRTSVGLTESSELFRSDPRGLFPVRLYRVKARP